MRTNTASWTAALLVGSASASYTGNLNYRSPSLVHPGLGLPNQKITKRSYAESPWKASELNFTHGVASGDPYDDSVILWTRAAPTMENDKSNTTVSGYVELYTHETDKFVQDSEDTVCVDWEIYTKTDGKKGKVASKGRVYTSSEIDFTVKIEATKLKPFTNYNYQFSICDSDNKSPEGRTKTLPARGKKVETPIKLAIFSCANYPAGFFNAYGNVVRKDSVDYIVHLGDYYYEYAEGVYGRGKPIGRVPQPDKQIFTLYDYRKRLASYRTDLDLYASHQNFPWIPTWDDHEIGDNTYKDGSSFLTNDEAGHDSVGISFDSRKANAVRAYFEWMPIRQVEAEDNLRIWRDFQFGDLFNLIMLDTRVYDRSITDLYTNPDYIKSIKNDNARSLMGARQEKWFYETLINSSSPANSPSSQSSKEPTKFIFKEPTVAALEAAKSGHPKKQPPSPHTKWRVVGNQAIFSRMVVSEDEDHPFNYDAWGGYLANRNRTFHTLYSNNISNTIMLAGDSHASWVSDLVWQNDTSPNQKEYNRKVGTGSVGVEFAGSAVTSRSPLGEGISLKSAQAPAGMLTAVNEELQWADLYYRGYYELEIGYEKVGAKYFGIPDFRTRNGYEIPIANFTVRVDENHLERYGGVKDVASPEGVVESGSLQRGVTRMTNVTLDTNTGEWFVFGEK